MSNSSRTKIINKLRKITIPSVLSAVQKSQFTNTIAYKQSLIPKILHRLATVQNLQSESYENHLINDEIIYSVMYFSSEINTDIISDKIKLGKLAQNISYQRIQFENIRQQLLKVQEFCQKVEQISDDMVSQSFKILYNLKNVII